MINELNVDLVSQLDILIEKHLYKKFIDLISELPYEQYIACVITYVQIYGLSVNNESPLVAAKPRRGHRQGLLRYKEISLRIESKVFKLVIRERSQTPFYLRKDVLYLEKYDLDIKLYLINHIGNDRNNGFYFPQRDGRANFDYIRFNPLNSGVCPGNCIFCHRCYHISTHDEHIKRKNWTVRELINAAINIYGRNCFSRAKHALLVTELFGNTKKYFDLCTELKATLKQMGFKGHFAALAQEVRSYDQISEFYDIVEGKDFCYTCECFENRDKLMSLYKGIPLEDVSRILQIAKQKGFSQVRINYIAGLDSLNGFRKTFPHISENIDSIGINLFTPQTDKQLQIRNKEAKCLSYYFEIFQILKKYSIDIYHSDLYERFPAIGA